VGRALADLPDERRRALELAVVSGSSHQAIAEALELPLETVQAQVRLGLLRVRAAMHEAASHEAEAGAGAGGAR
jgi:RNA polymerase sigma-70 factor (ECF subfamily)